jgi:hypothetical protein
MGGRRKDDDNILVERKALYPLSDQLLIMLIIASCLLTQQ